MWNVCGLLLLPCAWCSFKTNRERYVFLMIFSSRWILSRNQIKCAKNQILTILKKKLRKVDARWMCERQTEKETEWNFYLFEVLVLSFNYIVLVSQILYSVLCSLSCADNFRWNFSLCRSVRSNECMHYLAFFFCSQKAKN